MSRRDWPANLRCRRDGYYSWVNPTDGREYGLGRDKRAAFAQAVEANLQIMALCDKPRLVDRLNGTTDTTFADLAALYRQEIDKRLERAKIVKATAMSMRQRLATIETRWGATKVAQITTKDAADMLREYEDAGKERMAQSMRSFMLDVFNHAVAIGWRETNPVAVTKAVTVEVERSRLTLEDFRAIHAYAAANMAPRVARAMELALITGQRRDDLRNMGPKDISDGYLWVVQSKGGARVSIPVGIRLQVVNWSLSEVVANCRDAVLSKHFLHHNAIVGKARPGDPIRAQTISLEFAEARDKAGITGSTGKTPPTFHEIRSLAARLWTDERGEAFAKALLGHKSAEMAALYRDKRGDDWVRVPG
ncbi:site-specific integrase [Paramagnetospirillum magneticum]|nr:site-specific integrase [Paramagnetospirillum magneticum]